MAIRRLALWALALVLFLPLCAVAQDAEAPSWDDLREAYAYDHDLPLDIEIDGVDSVDAIPADGTMRRIEFTSLNDERVPAALVLPRAAEHGEGPYPAVVFGHGLGGSKDDWMYRLVVQLLAGNGFAAIMIDQPLHGERQPEELAASIEDLASITPEQAAEWIVLLAAATKQAVCDQLRAVDVLTSIDKVDPDRIGYMGLSLGAILGTPFSALEDRLACGVLVVGGADWAEILGETRIPGLSDAREDGILDPETLAAEMTESDPKYFAEHIGCPTLLIFGGQDDIVPFDPCGELLESLVPEPKQVKVFEESGHLLEAGMDRRDALGLALEFLKEQLDVAPPLEEEDAA